MQDVKILLKPCFAILGSHNKDAPGMRLLSSNNPTTYDILQMIEIAMQLPYMLIKETFRKWLTPTVEAFNLQMTQSSCH